MKKIIYIAVALAFIAIAVVQLKKNKETTVNRVYHFDKEQPINVQVITLKPESIDNDISYPGNFEPNKETKISADIQGKINSVLVDVGSVLRKGQVLIQLDNSLLKLQLQTVEIQIEGLEDDVKRYNVLANADAIQGVQLEKSELGLKSAKVQRATLIEQINKTSIVAPFGGIVTAKLTEEGAFAAPGVPLLQITDISVLKFTVNVPEQELSQFKVNQLYTLTADVYPETALSGRVIMTGSKANMGNSYPVQFLVNNTSDLKIKSGMFGQVQVKNENKVPQLIIPASAVLGTNIQPQVYSVKNGKAMLKNIRISTRFQNKVLVSSGLESGEVIVTNGFINLYDGANVSVSKYNKQIMNITQISINRPSLIIVLFSVFILLGIIGFKNLGYELLPDFNQPVVVIKTMYPGAEPNEVETSVSRKIEDALSNLEGVDYLETKSMPNASVIIANLKYGTDLNIAMQDAQRYIDNIRKDLPADILSPVMSKVSPNDLPIISISATSNLPATDFYQKMKDDYLPQIQQLKGVAEITLLGGEEREIQVKADQDKLKLYKISLYQVVEAINRSGIDLPAGKAQTDKESNSVRLIGKFSDVRDIMNVQVAMPAPGMPVYVKDVATVTDGVKDITSVSRYNGVNGIGLLLKKQGDANAVEVSKLVHAKLIQIEKANAAHGVKFKIADDSTEMTIAAVNSVVDDLILAVILVSLVMFLFLRSYRNSLIVLIAIPTSLVTAFAVMWLLGFTLNLMTLLAMSLIIGILVDDAIVVLENIQRHLDMGKEKHEAAMDGRMEIGFSAISITLVDVVVFLPILFLQVFVADMLKQFSIVVITSTLTSLLVGFTLVPWLASRIGKKEDLQPTNLVNRFLLWFERQLTTFIDWYGRQLEWVLSHKLIFTGIVLLLLVLTGVIMKQGIIGKEMMSTGDQGKFRLNLEYDKTTTVKQNNIRTQQVENFILQQPEVATLFSNIGGPSTGIGSLGVGSANISEFTIQLKPEKERNIKTEAYMKSLREELKNRFQGVNFSMAVLGLLPKQAPIKMTLSGNDLNIVMKTGDKLKAALEKIPGADNVRLSVEAGSPEYKVVPDKDKMQRLGLTTAYVGLNLRTAFTGNEDATLTENGTEYPVRIWLDDFDRKNYEDVQRLSIVNPMNVPVEVSQFADVMQDNSPSLLERLDRQPSVTLTSESFGRPSGTLADEAISFLKAQPLPEGVKLTWGADIKTQNESFGALGSVLLISFLLIYLIMVALYDNYIYPFVALFAIPMAAIGAFLALNLSLNHLTLFAQLGLIMLMGLVTKNAILIVDFTNQLKAHGKHYKEALIIAGKERMRPILMTTLAMAIGMLPIALARGTASEWKNGLAWVIIGGLLSSMILSVYLVPMVYYVVDRIKEKIAMRKASRTVERANLIRE